MVSRFDRFSLQLDRNAIFAGIAIFATGFIARGFFLEHKTASIISSPRKTLLPSLSKEQQLNLPYPPDALPGARDVDSPYGTIRVYEFGPDDGRKVLLIHGISTPCLTLGAVANGLAAEGCRVMLFDLFGRGYSDTPADLEHDVRLFTTQILLALASSPLSWTGKGSKKFSIVGYSLGGGIAAAFTSYFPDLVDSLILVAPSGLIRPKHFSRVNRVLYSKGLVPESILNHMVKKRLQTSIPSPEKDASKEEEVGAVTAASAEINVESNSQAVLSRSHPSLTVTAAVNHQVIHHQGFVQAFMSSIRNGPIKDQHDTWKRVGQAFSHRKPPTKVLIVAGNTDPIINKDELYEDATAVFDGNVEFEFLDAGHEIPVTKGDEIVQYILERWSSEP